METPASSQMRITDPPALPVFGVSHQFQPTDGSCSQTCLAMALDVPVSAVVAKFGGEPMSGYHFCNALTECDVHWNQMVHGAFIYEGWHFAVLPSLNLRGGNHRVLIHFALATGFCVLDPSTKERYARDGSDLRGWSYLMPFWPGGTLKDVVTGDE